MELKNYQQQTLDQLDRWLDALKDSPFERRKGDHGS